MKNITLAFPLLITLGLTQKKIFHSIKKKKFLIQSIGTRDKTKPSERLMFTYKINEFSLKNFIEPFNLRPTTYVKNVKSINKTFLTRFKYNETTNRIIQKNLSFLHN